MIFNSKLHAAGGHSPLTSSMGASQAKNYMNLKPAGWVREDYHILQGTRGEYFHGELHISKRQHLFQHQGVMDILRRYCGHQVLPLNVPLSQVPPGAIWKHLVSQLKTGKLNSGNHSVVTHKLLTYYQWKSLRAYNISGFMS